MLILCLFFQYNFNKNKTIGVVWYSSFISFSVAVSGVFAAVFSGVAIPLFRTKKQGRPRGGLVRVSYSSVD
jgi:hypothetical protein